MGFFDPLFDFNGDGKEDFDETMLGMQMMASSRREAIELTGDDTFYTGDDELDEEVQDELTNAGLDYYELAEMDEDERREALEDAGLDPDEFEDEF